MPAALRLQIMGPMRVWLHGVELDTGPHQQRCLLALLLARAGHPISMPELIGLLWGTEPPASAVNVIHKYVGVLRRLLEPALEPRSAGSYLVRHSNGYCFAPGAGTLDLAEFRELVDAAEATGLPDEDALARYADALRLCHGPAGEGLTLTAGGAAVLAAVNAEFCAATVAAADIALRGRQPSRMLNPLRLAAGMAPLHDPVHASLLIVLAATEQDAGVPRDVPVAHPAQLPPDLPLFTGRTAELAALGDLVAGIRETGRTGPLVVAASGTGGVGKTALAIHFAHRVAGAFADGQLYLDLRGDREDGTLPTADALLCFLYALGVTRSAIPELYEARMGLYRTLTAGRRILVMLDNVRDSAQVRPLLPNSSQSLVLVMSRRPLLGLAAFDGAYLLRVGLPDAAAARELFDRRLTRRANRATGGPADRETLDEIIGWCGRLPLALAIQGARFSARPALTPQVVAAELRDSTRRLGAFDCGPGLSDPRGVLSWAYRQLSPATAALFRLLSVVPGPGVTLAACASLAGSPAGRTLAELDELTDLALVTEDERGLFSTGSLAGAYAEELFRAVGTPADKRAAISRLLQHHLHSSYHAQSALGRERLPFTPPPLLPGVVPERPGAPFAWFSSRRAELTEAVRVAAELGYGIAAWQLALCLHPFLESAGLLQERDDVLGWALDAARRDRDPAGEAHILRVQGT
ncbi:hypothetical protein GCM10010435_26410 [Winogradskya consettensis]|uniref:OmpR/PhoB-type domain-containing protein n=1 Tax=Winogradskya consettensis TaxID=113560 RepID=A0A919SAP0_9ACTN|nr:BTAD domain-containing putative transcriptional regulator [Actinoplanes consettensis]GIM68088.1 hypothetical protein Aco04nite_09200 [Actinoplanes consettensis]